MTGLAVVLPDVPGGVVSQSQKEVDRRAGSSAAARSNWSTTASIPKKTARFNRKHSGRRSKAASR